MSHFYNCGSSLRNLDHVAEVRREHGPKPALLLYGSDGAYIGKIPFRYTRDIDEALAPAIPAAAGWMAVVIYTDGPSHGDRPTEAYAECLPIIGWRLREGASTPILIEDAASNGNVLILLPDGRVLSPFDRTYDSIASAQAGILEDDQASWDRQHAARGGKQLDARPFAIRSRGSAAAFVAL